MTSHGVLETLPSSLTEMDKQSLVETTVCDFSAYLSNVDRGHQALVMVARLLERAEDPLALIYKMTAYCCSVRVIIKRLARDVFSPPLGFQEQAYPIETSLDYLRRQMAGVRSHNYEDIAEINDIRSSISYLATTDDRDEFARLAEALGLPSNALFLILPRLNNLSDRDFGFELQALDELNLIFRSVEDIEADIIGLPDIDVPIREVIEARYHGDDTFQNCLDHYRREDCARLIMTTLYHSLRYESFPEIAFHDQGVNISQDTLDEAHFARQLEQSMRDVLVTSPDPPDFLARKLAVDFVMIYRGQGRLFNKQLFSVVSRITGISLVMAEWFFNENYFDDHSLDGLYEAIAICHNAYLALLNNER